MGKPKRTCFGMGVCLHIGTGADFWSDDGLCVVNPADAADYPQSQRLYAAGNIRGFSRPNIRTIFPDGADDVCTFNRGDYCWVYWNWGGSTFGTVKFELRDGSTVRATRSTEITAPPAPPGAISLVDIVLNSKVYTLGSRAGFDVIWRNNTDTYGPFEVGVTFAGKKLRQIVNIGANGLRRVGYRMPFDEAGTFEVVAMYATPEQAVTVTVLEKASSLINCTTTPRLGNVRVNIGDATLVTNLPSGGTNNIEFLHGSYTISVDPPAGYRVVSMNPPEGRFQLSEDLTIAVVLEKEPPFVPPVEPPEPPVEPPVVPPVEPPEPPVEPPVVPPVEPVEPPEPPVEPPFVPPEPPVLPPVAPPKYLTPAQADERVRSGLPCYIKCTLPLLDTIPGIRYTRGAWLLPFFTITSEP